VDSQVRVSTTEGDSEAVRFVGSRGRGQLGYSYGLVVRQISVRFITVAVFPSYLPVFSMPSMRFWFFSFSVQSTPFELKQFVSAVFSG